MANEKLDLISRSALIAEYDRVHIGTPGGARKLMEDAPTVDAAPVVHGHWEIRPNPYRVFGHEYACSVCGGWKHKLSYEHENMNYCPSCGSLMDGGNEDG